MRHHHNAVNKIDFLPGVNIPFQIMRLYFNLHPANLHGCGDDNSEYEQCEIRRLVRE